VLDLVSAQYTTWQDELGPAFVAKNIHFLTRKQWTARQRRWLHGYFENEVLPVYRLIVSLRQLIMSCRLIVSSFNGIDDDDRLRNKSRPENLLTSCSRSRSA
jgi:hypothetical protein